MNRDHCATRNHIEVDRSRDLPPRPTPLSTYKVLRGCRIGLAAWLAVTIAASVFLGPLGGLSVAALFLCFFIAFFLFRKTKGHTVKCSLLGALSGSLRVVDMVS